MLPQIIDPLHKKPAPLLKEKLLASAYRLRGAVSTLASLSSENRSFQGPNTSLTISEVVSGEVLPDF